MKIGSRIFRVHDRVMQTKNTEKVSNGDLGFITGITTNSKGERLVQMDFGGDRKLTYTTEQLAHVDLAYATTIHKAMGSEFETVIIPIVKAHTIMLYRNLLYTAVTRAKKKVILVGHKPILFMAVHRAGRAHPPVLQGIPHRTKRTAGTATGRLNVIMKGEITHERESRTYAVHYQRRCGILKPCTRL